MFKLFSTEVDKSRDVPITLFNSLTQRKEVFKPLSKGHMKMYSCGPTVYDHIHVGNLRAYLLPDLLKRVFHYNGYEVDHTINFTDFGHLTDDADAGEDKMMKALKREHMSVTLKAMREVAGPYIESFKRHNMQLNNLPPDHYTRASDYVQEQIKLIETLEEKGYTYTISDGVYFDISKFKNYGQLGNIDLEKLKSGARAEINSEKRHPADFALWKNGELGWKSKWGLGFPGWHIECTAMAFATLGRQIDIHTGGEDLMYTHHNGEIAQAECVTGKTFVQFWLHNALVTTNDEKMAKSEGNGYTLDILIEKGYGPEDYRYWLLTAHYRTTVNLTDKALNASRQALTRLKRFVYEEHADKRGVINDGYETRFLSAINDDLDTPKAIALMWDMIKDDSVPSGDKVETIRLFDSILGVGLSLSPEEGRAELGQLSQTELPEDIQTLLDERKVARIAQNWAESDRLREALKLKGYMVEDSEGGQKVSKV